MDSADGFQQLAQQLLYVRQHQKLLLRQYEHQLCLSHEQLWQGGCQPDLQPQRMQLLRQYQLYVRQEQRLQERLQQQQDHRSPHQDQPCPSRSWSRYPAISSFAAGGIVMVVLDIARESPEYDPHVRTVLDAALDEVMGRLRAAPDTYVMRSDEFALFSFFRDRFDATDGIIIGARKRYWSRDTVE